MKIKNIKTERPIVSKSLKINIILLSSTLLIVLTATYLLTFFYFTYLRGYTEVEVIKYKKEISFIKKYTKRLHHIRHHYQDYYKKERKPSNLLFSEEVNYKKKAKISFLFLGDSWFEQLISYSSSRAFVKNFFENKKINYTNAGISSYSPTLMAIQYKIIKNEFKIDPDYIVVYIDQTDFGDELCRYKKNKYYSVDNNELIGVNPDLIKIPKLIRISEISSSNNIKIIKDIKIFNFFLNLKYQLIKNKILKLNKKDKRFYGCSAKQILSYLMSSSDEDLNYFNASIKFFLDQLNNNQKVKKILLVSFPHRNQLTSVKNFDNTMDYTLNISDLIDSYLEKKNSHKFHHLNFTKLIESNKIMVSETSFLQKDRASHLNEKAHLNIFTKNIVEEINKLLE